MTSSKENKWLWLHTEDNVAVALADFAKDDRILMDGTELVLRQPVDFGHKFALRDIPQGQPIVKYAETIGIASQPITAGDHVHVHNVQSLRARRS